MFFTTYQTIFRVIYCNFVAGMRRFFYTTGLFFSATFVFAQEADSLRVQDLEEVTVSGQASGIRRLGGAVTGMRIGQEELFRAACCNLGESFTTNPSVDVTYSDAATGAKQIRLLGLSGTYVQMLTENLPNFRSAAAPFALGYVPGPWMKSIQVSKGTASVRNGYEAITGQIDIEYLKPEDDEGGTVNIYGDSKSRIEANADANLHIQGGVNTELLVHHENQWGHHDENDDGFVDKPNVRQWNLQNRWDYLGTTYIFHGGWSLLKENRDGGQTGGHHQNPFIIDVETSRYEAYMKHAVVLDSSHGANVALMASGSIHQMDARYGVKTYDTNEKHGYAQLMYETNFTPQHNLSAGLSLDHYYAKQMVFTTTRRPLTEKETVPGIYAQYTFNFNDHLTAMAGVRADHSSIYGNFVTPRLHLKISPDEIVSIRLSAGKGYRSPHALPENHNLLASGRTLVVDDRLDQEEAWNYGVSAAFNIPLAQKTLRLNAEYFYTDFLHQAIIDYDSDLTVIHITNLDGRSYSHTFQIDATYPLFQGLTLTAAYRLNDVKTTFGHQLMEKPLTSRYKGLFTASYKTPLGLWQVDATLQLNGGGRMPTPVDGLWDRRFPAYEQLSAQVTRWFRHFSVYVGGENLTAFRQKVPIIQADAPFSALFEPTMVWGPVHGAMFYAGVRVNFGHKL